jgi:hypothetical protein
MIARGKWWPPHACSAPDRPGAEFQPYPGLPGSVEMKSGMPGGAMAALIHIGATYFLMPERNGMALE